MKSTKQQGIGTVESNTNTAGARQSTPRVDGPDSASGEIRTTARDDANPVDYRHPYESMKRLAEALALAYDSNRTRRGSWRQVRFVHGLFRGDPRRIAEEQLWAASCRGAGEPSSLNSPHSLRALRLKATSSGKAWPPRRRRITQGVRRTPWTEGRETSGVAAERGENALRQELTLDGLP